MGALRHLAAAVGTAVVIGLTAGCATAQETPAGEPSPTPEGSTALTLPDSSPTPPALSIPDTLDCGLGPVPTSTIEKARPATDLDSQTLAELDTDADVEDITDWFVMRDEPEDLVILREAPREYDPFRSGFEVMAFSRDVDAVGYGMYAATACSFELLADGSLTTAYFVVDGVNVDPAEAAVPLLAQIYECSNGRAIPEEELVVTLLRETDTTVEIGMAGRPMWWIEPGEVAVAFCPGHEATPITVPLERPLGDRVVINAGVYPASPVSILNAG